MLGAAKCYRTRLYVIYEPNFQILVALLECKMKTIQYLYVGVLELFDMQKGGFHLDGVRRVDTNQDCQTISESVPLAYPFENTWDTDPNLASELSSM